MYPFVLCEIVQFLLGLFIVVISYLLIMRHRGPILDFAFSDNVKLRRSFETLTCVGYFFVFIPILLVGINFEPPAGQNLRGHIQRIIYFEAGLIFLIGILHLGMTVIFSTFTKKPQGDK